MPDITMCTNKTCPSRNGCYRYKATPSERQSYSRFEADGCTYLIPLTPKEVDILAENEPPDDDAARHV